MFMYILCILASFNFLWMNKYSQINNYLKKKSLATLRYWRYQPIIMNENMFFL